MGDWELYCLWQCDAVLPRRNFTIVYEDHAASFFRINFLSLTSNTGKTSRPGSNIQEEEAELKVGDVRDVRPCSQVKVYRRFGETKFDTDGPQMLGATAQNVVPWAA